MIHIYAKTTEDINSFGEVLSEILTDGTSFDITIESRRSFQSFQNLKAKILDKGDIVVVSSLAALGLNNAEIGSELQWFIDTSSILVVMNIPSTYEYSLEPTINKAVLHTIICQSLLPSEANVNSISQNKRSNSGRNKLPFPDDWDELYEQWENKEISSKEFLNRSGLKKASFYNLISEYKEIRKTNEQFINKLNIG